MAGQAIRVSTPTRLRGRHTIANRETIGSARRPARRPHGMSLRPETADLVRRGAHRTPTVNLARSQTRFIYLG